MAQDYLKIVDGEELGEKVVEERHLTDAFFAALATQAEQDALSAALTQADNDEVTARSDADTAILAQKGAANGIATLGADQKIPTSQIPALAITSVSSVADIAARDALNPEEGDLAVVTDAGAGTPATYIYDGTAWVQVSVDSEVLSVNGQTGVVVLAKGDVGLGNVDNVQQEPAFSKNTAFNKNFGTGAGQVAEGNHEHSVVLGLRPAAGRDTESGTNRSIVTGISTITGYALTLESASAVRWRPIVTSIVGGTINYIMADDADATTTAELTVGWVVFGA